MTKIFDILQWLRRWYWRTFKIQTVGVRVIIKKDNSFLLVKHRYGNLWVFPGGGVKKCEDSETACRRETLEEANIHIISFEKHLGTYKNTTGGKNDTVTVLVAKEWKENGPDKWSLEIKEKGFFSLNELPAEISSATRRRIQEYLSGEDHYFTGNW